MDRTTHRRSERQHELTHGPEPVGCVSRRGGSEDLLDRMGHLARTAEQLSEDEAELGDVGAPGRLTIVWLPRRPGAIDDRDAEVGEVAVAELVEQDVGGRQVTVGQARCMGDCEGGADLLDKASDVVERQSSVTLEPLLG